MRMNVKTYYINMEKDIQRNEHMIKELNQTNLCYERFPGIDGRHVDKDKYIKEGSLSSFADYCLTDKMMGCGLSHIMLYKHIRNQQKQPIDYALILEDDVKVSHPHLDYSKEINAIIAQHNITHPHWQIIRLHSMGFDLGSGAAYIISTKHIESLANMRLLYHVDIQQSFQYHIVHLNTLFETKDHETHYKNPLLNICVQHQKVGFYLHQHAFSFLHYVVYGYHIFYCILLLFFYHISKPFLLRK